MRDARAKELEYFQKKSDYQGLRNVGTGHLSTELSEKLISSVRRQLPNISGFVNKSIMDLQKELEAMGGPAANSRGEMIHLVLTLCRKFETTFGKLIDGGKGGGCWGLGSGAAGRGGEHMVHAAGSRWAGGRLPPGPFHLLPLVLAPHARRRRAGPDCV